MGNSPIPKPVRGGRPGPDQELFYFQTRWSLLPKFNFRLVFSLLQLGLYALGIFILRPPESRSSELSLIAGILLASGLALILFSSINFPYKISVGTNGIKMVFGALRRRKRLAWSELAWRSESDQAFWLTWDDEWLRIDHNKYPMGRLLLMLVQEHCPQAELPSGPISITQAKDHHSRHPSSLEWSGNALRSGENGINLSVPIKAKRKRDGILELTQEAMTIKILADDPRRPAIEYLPEVAAALCRQKQRRALR